MAKWADACPDITFGEETTLERGMFSETVADDLVIPADQKGDYDEL